MSWITLLLLGIVAFLVYLVIFQPDSRGMPPGPKGLPLVGNIFDLLWKNSPEYFANAGKEYGPVYSIQMMTRRIVVINSSKMLTQAFVKQGDMFNHRPRGTVLSFIMGGKGIADAEDKVWRDSRRFTLHTLRNFGMGRNKIETYVEYEMQDFLLACKNKVGQPYNLHYDLATSILNIVWHMIVGKRFEMGDKTLKWIVDSIELSLTLVEQGGFVNYTPFVLQFIYTFFKPRAMQVGLNVRHRLEMIQALIKEHKATLDQPDRGSDLMYDFLEEQRKATVAGEKDSTFTDEQLMWLCSDLLIVGLDTTVTTLRWAFLFMLRHPDIQEKLYKEVESKFGHERTPTYEERTNMPYTEAFMQEVFRFGSITPLALHGTPEETTLDGYRIPKRTWVVGNVYAVHWDKETWGDPENFRPERFLDDKGEISRDLYDNVVVFSVGRRNCLGESLARIEFFLFLTGLVQKYHVGLPKGDPMPTTDYHCGVTLNPHEFNVILSEREGNTGE